MEMLGTLLRRPLLDFHVRFHPHGRAPPGLSGVCMMQTIRPKFVDYPQLLHALAADGQMTRDVHRGVAAHTRRSFPSARASFSFSTFHTVSITCRARLLPSTGASRSSAFASSSSRVIGLQWPPRAAGV